MKTAAEEIRESIAELKEWQAELKRMVIKTELKIYDLEHDAYRFTESERIRVPDNIKFEQHGSVFALVSPNGICTLSGSQTHGGVPNVGMAGNVFDSAANIITDPLYLEPCKREDLKCGDVALCFDEDSDIEATIDEISEYAVILNDTEYAMWDDQMSAVVDDLNYEYWYKVV